MEDAGDEEEDEIQRARTALMMIWEQCERAREEHAKRARIWGRVHVAIGLPAAILAAVAGVSALISTTGRIPAGIIAIISAGLGSAATFLDSQGRQEKNDRLANGFAILMIECSGYIEVETHQERWMKSTFPREIVRIRKEYYALLKDRSAKDLKPRR